ncbi:hypothetical protein SFRURICE_004942 [Spodoptera frugiperda]|nr:hypothetical protein SFRURICE_004942 [Spodoptera frugiperda]
MLLCYVVKVSVSGPRGPGVGGRRPASREMMGMESALGGRGDTSVCLVGGASLVSGIFSSVSSSGCSSMNSFSIFPSAAPIIWRMAVPRVHTTNIAIIKDMINNPLLGHTIDSRQISPRTNRCEHTTSLEPTERKSHSSVIPEVPASLCRAPCFDKVIDPVPQCGEVYVELGLAGDAAVAVVAHDAQQRAPAH